MIIVWTLIGMAALVIIIGSGVLWFSDPRDDDDELDETDKPLDRFDRWDQ